MTARALIVLPDETVVNAVVGWRSWRISSVAGKVTLTSLTSRARLLPGEHEWAPGEVKESRCLCGGKTRMHTCGIYAYNRPYRPGTAIEDFSLRPYTYIVGEVHLWGTVHIHKDGYRAQYARPASFYTTDAMNPRQRLLVELASLQFDVPTVRYG